MDTIFITKSLKFVFTKFMSSISSTTLHKESLRMHFMHVLNKFFKEECQATFLEVVGQVLVHTDVKGISNEDVVQILLEIQQR